MRLITFTGMSRSGNHAVIRWLIAHLENAGHEVWFHNNSKVDRMDHLSFVMPHVNASTNKVLLVSFEDVHIDGRMSALSGVAHRNVLLLRDPLNLFASRVRGLAPPRGTALPAEADARDRAMASVAVAKEMPGQIGNYINHYREFSGATFFLHNKVCVDYNKWIIDKAHGTEVVERGFGLPFMDSWTGEMSNSSFGSPRGPSDFLSRWRSCWEERAYRPVRESRDLVRISREMGVSGV